DRGQEFGARPAHHFRRRLRVEEFVEELLDPRVVGHDAGPPPSAGTESGSVRLLFGRDPPQPRPARCASRRRPHGPSVSPPRVSVLAKRGRLTPRGTGSPVSDRHGTNLAVVSYSFNDTGHWLHLAPPLRWSTWATSSHRTRQSPRSSAGSLVNSPGSR